jgi:hypothetical protein
MASIPDSSDWNSTDEVAQRLARSVLEAVSGLVMLRSLDGGGRETLEGSVDRLSEAFTLHLA